MNNSSSITLQQAQQAVKVGNKKRAYQLLASYVRQNPKDYIGWLWLAGIMPTREKGLYCLQRAEELQPGHPRIQQARDWFEKQTVKSRPPVAVVTPPVLPPTPAPIVAETPLPAPVPVTAPVATPSPVGSPRRSFVWGIAGMLALCLVGVGVLTVWLRNRPLTTVEPTAPRPAIAQVAAQEETDMDADHSLRDTIEETIDEITAGGEQHSDDEQEIAETEGETGLFAGILPFSNHTSYSAGNQPEIQPKQIRQTSNQQANPPRWTPTPLPTPTPQPTPTPPPTPTFVPVPPPSETNRTVPIAPGEHWVDVNLSSQVLTAYVGNEPVFSTYISSGLPQFATVTGQFRIYLEYESQNMSGAPYGYDYYLPNVPHVMYFYQGYALHGAYWHTEFGTQQSHGCVNLALEDAEYIWQFADIGTLVNVHY